MGLLKRLTTGLSRREDEPARLQPAQPREPKLRQQPDPRRLPSQDPQVYEKTHLLSISIDPAYDTPEVLRSYGAAHTERYEKETFAHWEFAGGTSEQVKDIAQFFGLTYFPDKDQIIHALRTVIVSPEGKVAKVYTGNDWKPEEVVDEMKKANR